MKKIFTICSIFLFSALMLFAGGQKEEAKKPTKLSPVLKVG